MSIVAFWILFSTSLLLTRQKESTVTLYDIPQAKSEIIGKENRHEREEYLRRMLADPQTGKVPENIEKRELAYVKTMAKSPFKVRQTPPQGNSEVFDQGREQVLNWRAIGPFNFGGRTRALAIDVTNENVILAGGVTGGLWRSEDGGQSWTKTTGSSDLHSVSAIVQDTRAGRENTWYYGTGELRGNSATADGAPFRGDGIFKSTDGGRSWQLLPSTATNEPTLFNFPFNYVWELAINPNSTDDEVYAAIFGGIVKSTDGGANWETILGEDLLNLPADADLNEQIAPFYTDIHVANDGTFYTAVSSATNQADELFQPAGIYRSNDGENWELIRSLRFSFNRRTEIGSSGSDPAIVYFLTDNPAGYQLVRYDASQGNFTELSDNIPALGGEVGDFDSQDSYDMYVKIHPSDPNVVFLGGTNLYRSTDGFTSSDNTAWIGGYSTENDNSAYENHHPDQHALVFYPSDPNRMLTGNDGGIFRTANNLATEVSYESLNNGYVTSQFYTVNVARAPSDNFVMGGLQDNGSILTFNQVTNPNGVRALGGDGGFAATTAFGLYYYVSFQNSQVYRLTLSSQSNLTSFARVDPVGGGNAPGQGYLFVNPYVLDPHNSNRMYMAGGNLIWRNRNLSQIPSGSQEKTSVNWSQLERTRIISGQISALEVSSEPANILYYGTSDGRVFRVDDANTDDYSVTEIASGTFPTGGYVSSVAVDPSNTSHIIVTFSNYHVRSVFHSENGGTSFTDISGNLEESLDGAGDGPSVRWAEIVPLNDGSFQYYLGTSTGAYSTTLLAGNGTVWEQEGADEIGNVVVSMIDYRRTDGTIAVATHGNGLYTSQISNVRQAEEVDFGSELFVRNPYPNPFDEEVTMAFTAPETTTVLVRVYNTVGELVKVISRGTAFIGENEVIWDGKNVMGQPVPDGVYTIRITDANGKNVAKQVILSRG